MKKTNSASVFLGLSVVLNNFKEAYANNLSVTQYEFDGVRLLIHSPFDFPEVAGKGMAIGANMTAYIGIAGSHTER